MKKIIHLLLLFVPAIGFAQSQITVIAPKHPHETVRITVHGCDDGVLTSAGKIIAPTASAKLGESGTATIQLPSNDKELKCINSFQSDKPWKPHLTRYGVLIMANGKPGIEKLITVRTGKTKIVKF